MKRSLNGCGWLAALVYAGTVVLGAAITPGYSHAANAISELIQTGAPHKQLLDGLFIVYNVLVVLFGLGLLGGQTRGSRRALTAGAWALIGVGLSGAAMPLFFPQDPRGAVPTFPGQMHLVLAGISSVLTIVATFSTGLGLSGSWRRYSIASGLLVVVTGPLTVAAVAAGSPLLGVAERLTIGGFIQWLLAVSWMLSAHKTRVAVAHT